MFRALVIALSLATVFAAVDFTPIETSREVLTPEQYLDVFSGWIRAFGKNYELAEIPSRFATFKANLDHIRAHNAGNSSFTLGLNEFSAMNSSEFSRTMKGLLPGAPAADADATPFESRAPPPASWDWRQHGAVNGIKNQGCWAFATVSSLESAMAIGKKGLPNLSEQQLVDCAGPQGNHGCNGGYPVAAYQYIYQFGSCTQQSYPYTARQGTCHGCTVAAKLTRYHQVGNEGQLQGVLAQQPVVLCLHAEGNFQHYKSGIFDMACPTQSDHVVLAIGYGTEGGRGYWIVRNSWGTSWGEGGYIRMIAGKNMCGLAQAMTFPTL